MTPVAYTEPTLLDESLHPTELLDSIASDPLPSRQDDRAHIEAAIWRCLREHGRVHIALVRPYITRDVWPPMLGAAMNAWGKRHGECIGWEPNGDTKSGNGAKPSRVWRLREVAR